MREVFGMSDWILVVDDDVLNLKMAKAQQKTKLLQTILKRKVTR